MPDTGFIDEHVRVMRKYIVNVFFYTKGGRTIMIDAGCNYPRLGEKLRLVTDKLWVGLSPIWKLSGMEDVPYIQSWKIMLEKRLALTVIWPVLSCIHAGLALLLNCL